MQSHINVGYGEDVTIADLAHGVANAVGVFLVKFYLIQSKPDGSSS
jgi:GDP-L-fucose synthase